jgi:hypothetical protein
MGLIEPTLAGQIVEASDLIHASSESSSRMSVHIRDQLVPVRGTEVEERMLWCMISVCSFT